MGAVTTLGIVLASSAMAQDYKIGDAMPDYKNGVLFDGQVFFTKEDKGENCNGVYQFYNKGSKTKYMAAFPSMDYGVLPYGIFDYDTKMLIIDNKNADGSIGPDGIIDKIFENPQDRDLLTDHPYCQTEDTE